MQLKNARIGIVAGSGTLPREIGESLVKRGIPVHIVALEGAAAAEFGDIPQTRFRWGELSRLLRALRDNGVTHVVIIGGVKRPELSEIRLDLGFFRSIPLIIKIVAAGGDDGVLRRVIRFFESNGFPVIGPADAAPEIAIGLGPLGAERAGPEAQRDIELGFDVVRALGHFDVGQSVVVAQGRVEAIEGVEGTDRMLARVEAQRKDASRAAGPQGVLVKRSKPGQDLRIDVPTIGPLTARRVHEAGLTGIAVEAGRAHAAEREAAIGEANALRLFIEGIADDGRVAPAGRTGFEPGRCVALTSKPPSPHHERDAQKAAAAVQALAPFGVGDAVVSIRDHVIAVETGEGAVAVLGRAAGLRPWSSLTFGRRGMLALRRADDLSDRVLSALAETGFAGVALLNCGRVDAAFSALIQEANRLSLHVLRIDTLGETS